MTPQTRTWLNNPEIQLKDTYQNWTGEHPIGYPKYPVLDKSWHPAPGNLKLGYSYQGEWAKIPVDRDDKSGPNYKKYHIVRIEKYVDEDGIIRKAICYQKDANELYIWFKYEEIMDTFTNWVTPTPSYYFNGRRWGPDMRKEYAHRRDEPSRRPSRDHSRGRYRHRRHSDRSNSREKKILKRPL